MKGNSLMHITLALALSLFFMPVVLAYENFCLEFKAANNGSMDLSYGKFGPSDYRK